jgi:uroporphyrinogen-III decarboxylase
MPQRESSMSSWGRVKTLLKRERPELAPHALYDVAIDTFNPSTIELFARKLGKHPRDAFHHDLQGIGIPAPRMEKDFGKVLILFGAISVQHTLPFGTPADVMNEVRIRMETVGQDGGYIMTPSHLINADIPWENIVAFFEAAQKYGR